VLQHDPSAAAVPQAPKSRLLALSSRRDFARLPAHCPIRKVRDFSRSSFGEKRVIPFFVQIKCHLGKSYAVANALADAEIASEIYSTAGDFDLLVKFYVEQGTDIGHFVNEKVQTLPGIQDTRTIITFKAF
jgi:DNA-binding Lrp family transcriptional regulator